MANIRIPCLVGRSNQAGVTSWYWQPSKTLRAAGWEPVALGKDEGKALADARARNAEVERWKAGDTRPAAIAPRVATGTMGALIALYRRKVIGGTKPGSERPRLRGKTIEAYETSLKRIEAWAGKHPVAYITAPRIQILRDKNVLSPARGGIGHAATFNMLRVLRQLFAFAEAENIIPRGSNPATSFGLAKPPPRSQVWTVEDEAAFDAAARELGLPGLVLARELALYTAQRRSDLIRFTEAQLQPLNILEPVLAERLAAADGKVWGWQLSQAKTSTEYVIVGLEIPLEPEILARVQAAIRTHRARDRAATPPRLQTYVLIDDRTGLPWNKDTFTHAWRSVLDHAADRLDRPHMRDLVWHDLRRTRVVRLRRRGMAKEMIAALTGHSLRSIEEMLRVYGPVDPTITANAIVASLEPRKDPEAPARPSNISV